MNESQSIRVLNVRLDNITIAEALCKAEDLLNSGKQHYIVTANAEIIVAAQKNTEFRQIINRASLVLPDGFGPVFASKLLSKDNYLKERITGVDTIYRLARHLSDSRMKFKVFFLGAKEGVAKAAAQKLKKIFPDLKIAGTFSGEAGEKGDRVAVSIINQAKPDILFVAYGAPKQEKWIGRNLNKIPSVKLAVGVGGAFDIISGKIKRAPFWMRNRGLEWLWRLIKEPSRIGRIYNATIKFSWLVLTKKERK